MTRYALTEAYSEIYDYRKSEELFDNLRFVDYMLDEDIEEVVESLVWEFRDYGNTLDEAFDILHYAVQPEIITESYQEFINNVLTEATVTRGRGRATVTSSTDRPTTPGAGSSRITLGRGGRPESQVKFNRQTMNLTPDQEQRRAARAARISNAVSTVKKSLSGPIRSVKQGISGAAGGMGKAAKALGKGAVEKGKALLKGLLRRGGQALTATGRAVERSGRKAAAATPTTRTARVGRTTVTATTEPGGAKRQAVGRTIRRLGAALQRGSRGGDKDSKMTRSEYEQRKREREAAAKSAASDAFATPRALPPARPETETRRAAVQRKLDTAARGTAGTETRVVRPRLALPAARPETATRRAAVERRNAAAKKLEIAATGTQARGVRFAGPRDLSPTRTRKGYQERLARFAKQLNKEDYEYLIDSILEDIIATGYAMDESTALDVLEGLSENTVIDIALEYLND